MIFFVYLHKQLLFSELEYMKSNLRKSKYSHVQFWFKRSGWDSSGTNFSLLSSLIKRNIYFRKDSSYPELSYTQPLNPDPVGWGRESEQQKCENSWVEIETV